jgi:t-SNARE complex subunit (syntaxin)
MTNDAIRAQIDRRQKHERIESVMLKLRDLTTELAAILAEQQAQIDALKKAMEPPVRGCENSPCCGDSR